VFGINPVRWSFPSELKRVPQLISSVKPRQAWEGGTGPNGVVRRFAWRDDRGERHVNLLAHRVVVEVTGGR
jgi:hypothetical protein